jgi:macrolide-specific efflux system membrane fusion protein
MIDASMRSFFSSAWGVIKKHWLLITILAVLAVGGAVWWFSQARAQSKEIIFVTPQQENITKTLDISGVVDAREKARLRFAVGGKLVGVNVQEGDRVKKWQTVAVIDQATLQKQLQQDLNLYMKERSDWEQRLDDTQDRTLPERELRQKDQAQWDLNNEVLDVEIRDIAIRNTVLSAPFPGIITSAPATTPGIVLSATDYFEIVNPDTLEFVAEVDEADIAKVAVGQAAKLTLDAFPDEILQTSVKSISYASKQGESGTVFEVTFGLSPAQSSSLIRLGMNGDISIELESKTDVLTIPLIVTRQRDGKTYVDVKTGEKTYAEREIEVGLETDEKVEVVSGLQKDDQVLSPEDPS